MAGRGTTLIGRNFPSIGRGSPDAASSGLRRSPAYGFWLPSFGLFAPRRAYRDVLVVDPESSKRVMTGPDPAVSSNTVPREIAGASRAMTV